VTLTEIWLSSAKSKGLVGGTGEAETGMRCLAKLGVCYRGQLYTQALVRGNSRTRRSLEDLIRVAEDMLTVTFVVISSQKTRPISPMSAAPTKNSRWFSSSKMGRSIPETHDMPSSLHRLLQPI
jgi:hypothetical protein